MNLFKFARPEFVFNQLFYSPFDGIMLN